MLSKIHAKIRGGEAAWGLLMANEYLAENDALRLVLVKQAIKNGLDTYKYKSIIAGQKLGESGLRQDSLARNIFLQKRISRKLPALVKDRFKTRLCGELRRPELLRNHTRIEVEK